MTRISRHAVNAAMQLAGVQSTDVSVHHPGSPEAVVTVAVGRSVIYLHTLETARRFADVWRDGLVHTLRLPHRQRLTRPQPHPKGIDEPSLVVHATGVPAGYLRFSPRRGDIAEHLTINLDARLAFDVYDRIAFRCCAEAFAEAGETARDSLPTLAQRARIIAARAADAGETTEPAELAARDRELARHELAALQALSSGTHPAARAAAAMGTAAATAATSGRRLPTPPTTPNPGTARRLAGRRDAAPAPFRRQP